MLPGTGGAIIIPFCSMPTTLPPPSRGTQPGSVPTFPLHIAGCLRPRRCQGSGLDHTAHKLPSIPSPGIPGSPLHAGMEGVGVLLRVLHRHGDQALPTHTGPWGGCPPAHATEPLAQEQAATSRPHSFPGTEPGTEARPRSPMLGNPGKGQWGIEAGGGFMTLQERKTAGTTPGRIPPCQGQAPLVSPTPVPAGPMAATPLGPRLGPLHARTGSVEGLQGLFLSSPSRRPEQGRGSPHRSMGAVPGAVLCSLIYSYWVLLPHCMAH